MTQEPELLDAEDAPPEHPEADLPLDTPETDPLDERDPDPTIADVPPTPDTAEPEER